jgi:serine protease Do
MRSCVLLIATILSPAPAAGQEPTRRQLLDAFEKQLAETAAKAGPGVACVVVSRSEHYPKAADAGGTPGKLGSFDPKEFLKADPTLERARLAKSLDLADARSIPDHGYAGGVVIDSAGLVLTLYHVIEGATKVYVHLPGGVGSYADIHAADARSDLAVLKLIDPPAKGLTPIKFADVRTRDRGLDRATVFPGKLVVLLANPYSPNFRMDRPGAAFGAITNVRYRLPSPQPDPDRKDGGTPTAAEKLASYYKCGMLFEHDVRVNGGVTGGALVNLDGELVGLITATAVVYNREIGPGYAIPADENFRRLVEVLKRGEEIEHGFLGVPLPGTNTAVPIRLEGVTPNGPAENAGLRAGDVITHINGHPAETFDDLILHIGTGLAGSKVKVRVSRFREALDLEVTLAKFNNDRPYVASVRPEPVFGLRVDFGSTRPVALAGGRGFNPPQGIPPGVWIREVVADSPAATKFKALGEKPEDWTVVKVNDAEVSTPGEFYKAARGLDKVKLTLRNPQPPGREREMVLP